MLEAEEGGHNNGEQEDEGHVLVAKFAERQVEQHSIRHRLPEGDGEPADVRGKAVQICVEPEADVEGNDVEKPIYRCD